VVAVVVDQREAAAARHGHVAIAVKRRPTPAKPARPACVALSAMPISRAMAMAEQAFCTLCRPGWFSTTSRSG
jgi:hypothetical protein